MNTKRVVSKILHEKYLKKSRKPLKGFKEITGGLTKVIISPRINEISKELAHNYSMKAIKDVKQRDDQYANDIQRGKEPKFKDVFRKIGNRAAGIQKASRRSLRHEWAPWSVSHKIERDS